MQFDKQKFKIEIKRIWTYDVYCEGMNKFVKNLLLLLHVYRVLSNLFIV